METIIVGTDFSLPATNAVNYASGLAKFFSARLILVNAFSLPLAGYDSMEPLDMIAELQQNSVSRLNELKNDIIKRNYDFGIECVSAIGSSFATMRDVANKYSADLAVMGMVGEGSFVKKYLVGSSAIHSARELSIPLFIVPEAAKYHKIHQIAFACDMEKIEETTLLHSAKYFASVFDAEIELVTVNQNSDDGAWNKNEPCSFVEKRLETVRHKNVHIRDNNVSQALQYYFKFHKTDLVIVNPKKHGFFQTLFAESITKNLAFSMEVPLLIIH